MHRAVKWLVRGRVVDLAMAVALAAWGCAGDAGGGGRGSTAPENAADAGGD